MSNHGCLSSEHWCRSQEGAAGRRHRVLEIWKARRSTASGQPQFSRLWSYLSTAAAAPWTGSLALSRPTGVVVVGRDYCMIPVLRMVLNDGFTSKPPVRAISGVTIQVRQVRVVGYEAPPPARFPAAACSDAGRCRCRQSVGRAPAAVHSSCPQQRPHRIGLEVTPCGKLGMEVPSTSAAQQSAPPAFTVFWGSSGVWVSFPGPPTP